MANVLSKERREQASPGDSADSGGRYVASRRRRESGARPRAGI